MPDPNRFTDYWPAFRELGVVAEQSELAQAGMFSSDNYDLLEQHCLKIEKALEVDSGPIPVNSPEKLRAACLVFRKLLSQVAEWPADCEAHANYNPDKLLRAVWQLLQEMPRGKPKPPAPKNERLSVQEGLHYLDHVIAWCDQCPGAQLAKGNLAGSRTNPSAGIEFGAEATTNNGTPQVKNNGEVDVKSQAEPALNERAGWVIKALLNKAAFDSDHRMTTAKTVEKAVGKTADPNPYKAVIADLKRLGYVETKEGRSGGCWLTPLGRTRAEKL